MNLSALKSFAPAVRRQLIEAIGRKLDYVLSADTPDLRGRKKQIDSLRRRKESNREILVENVAYTWFNRLAALRFIDAREWHPFGMRIITAANSSESQPEILRATRNGALPAELANFTDSKRLNSILDGHIPSNDPQGEVYRHLVLAACRFYHNLMPFLFEDIDDETELLLPDDLLTEHSIANGFRTEISDEDCSEVEILGWLYQFYISEKKDAVMARKKAVPTEDIPAVTQLFTPHWIVRYLVENSLGRLWLLNHPKSTLREKMPYYIEEESGAGVPPAIAESGAGVSPAISGGEEAGRKECGAGVPPAISGGEEAGRQECGAGVPPAISGGEEAGRQECGAGVSLAISGGEEAGRKECGAGVPPAISGGEEAGKQESGAGVSPAISGGEEAGRQESGAGVSPAISGGEDAGRKECGVGVSPAISGGEEAGRMPAPHSSGKMPAISNFQPFNPYEEIEATRRRLPHWQQEGTAYFITFRLADSIPQEKLAQWEAERKQWLATHPQPWDETAVAEYSKLFSERRQQWLDNGYGRCLLKLPDVAEIVRSALLHFDGQRYLLDEFVLMPNHVHIIVKLLPDHDLSSVLHSWKSFTAKEINKAIEGTGTIWQDESYDHIVRSDSQLEFYRNYIRENPAKAGLKQIKSQSGIGIPQESGAGVPPAIEEREEAGRQESGAGVPPAIAEREEAGKMPAPHSSQCGAGVPPAIAERKEAGKMPAPHSSQCGAGVPPAIAGREETGKMPAPRSSQCGVGVSPAIAGREEAGKMPAPRSSTDFLKITSPEEIRLIDPACGSAHMLTYSFDLLYSIYEEEGHSPNEIPGLILKNNLFGLEICPRAAQLAQFALVCKAREKSRTAFRNPVQPQVMCLQDILISPEEISNWLSATGQELTQNELAQIHQFNKNTSNFGALIKPVLNVESLAALRIKIGDQSPVGDLILQDIHRRIMLVINQAEMLSQCYHLVVANPPYKGKGELNVMLQEFMEGYYPRSKGDLFGCFIERGIDYIFSHGFNSMVTMQAWLFIDTFKDLRGEIIDKHSIINLIQIGFNSFPELNSKFALAAAFTLCKDSKKNDGHFITLNNAPKNADKEKIFFEQKDAARIFRVNLNSFKSIEGMPLSFEASENLRKAFRTSKQLRNLAEPRQGMATGDNDRFVRYWFEVALSKIGLGFTDRKLANASHKKWFPYNKGGGFRKWYGNQIYVVNWENDGSEIQSFVDSKGKLRSRPQNKEYYFKESITWSLIGLTFGPRYCPSGFLFDVGGSSAFPPKEQIEYIIAFMSSKISSECLMSLNPTLNYQVGDIQRLPIKNPEKESIKSSIKIIARENIDLSMKDWNRQETSWDFQDHPLLLSEMKSVTLDASWRNWEAQSIAAIRRMQELETENNQLFIATYGLEDELSPEVPEEQITLARADAHKDMVAFLSYSVGCMMGRYSLDKPGIILANAGDTLEEYWNIMESGKESGAGVPPAICSGEEAGKMPAPHSSPAPRFIPDEDGIIPVLDGEWFEDDVESRFRQFLRVTFGDENFEENLRFIEESLGKDIRKYFLTDFYKDHVQTYKKRPIYWMFQSPKKGFQCLIYMHRYNRDTVNRILNRYLREYLVKLRSRISQLEHQLTSEGLSAKERARSTKEMEQLRKTIRECEEYEREVILPLAQQRIEIDLDDGVKVNYLKFGTALATIPGLAAKEEE
jgi:REP element-mobilizing transposase RayT